MITQDLKRLFQTIEINCGVTEEQIKSKSRVKYVADARALLSWYLIRKCGYDIKLTCDLINSNRSSIYHHIYKMDYLNPDVSMFEKLTDNDIINKALESNPSEELKEYLLNFNK